MLNPEYVTGLVDGEGSFTVFIRNPDENKNAVRRVRAEPRFYVKLVEKDKNILYALKEFFGCGNIYFQRDKRKNHQNCYRFEVANRGDLERIIIPFFKKHLLRLNSKKKDFKIFCEIMRRIKRGDHLTKAGLRNLYVIKGNMH